MQTGICLISMCRLHCCAAAQIKQPNVATGVSLYSCGSCIVQNIEMPTAAGFGFYDGTSTASNTYQYAPPGGR
jgi:hypothetical protein